MDCFGSCYTRLNCLVRAQGLLKVRTAGEWIHHLEHQVTITQLDGKLHSPQPETINGTVICRPYPEEGNRTGAVSLWSLCWDVSAVFETTLSALKEVGKSKLEIK